MKDKTLMIIAVAVMLSVAIAVVAVTYMPAIKTRSIYINPDYNTTCYPVHPTVGENITSGTDFYLEIYYTTDSPYRIGINWHIKDLNSGWEGLYSMLDDMRLDHDITSNFYVNHNYRWYVEIFTSTPSGWVKLWSNEDDPWTFNTKPAYNPKAPVADAGGPYYGYIGEAIQFDGSNSYDPDGYIVKYEWDFGVTWESATATGVSPTYTYTSAPPSGYYNVVLTVTDNEGYTSADTTLAYVSVSPNNTIPVSTFSYSPDVILPGQPVYFDGSASYDPDGTIVGWNWDFGDGYKISGTNPTVNHTYSEGGTYIVTLEVVDNMGGTSIISKTISVERTYLLTVFTSGDGSVSVSPYSPDNKYVEGTEITLTATPSANWVFDHWEGGVNGSQNPTSFKISSDTTVTAYFSEKQQYTVTVSANPTGGGIVTLKPSGGTYDVGNNIAVTAIPNNGYRFDHWSGDVTGTQNQVVLTIDGDKTIVAHFEKTGAPPWWWLSPMIILLIVGTGMIFYNERRKK